MEFFRKKLTHQQKLNQAYSSFNADKIHNFFPEGKAQAERVVRSLAKLTGTDIEDGDVPCYKEYLCIFVDTFIRYVLFAMHDDIIIDSHRARYPKVINEENVVPVFLYCTVAFKNPSFTLENEEDMSFLQEMQSHYENAQKISKENEEIKEINIKDQQYGLVPDKPVYAYWTEGSREYLDHLCGKNGERLTWERKGCVVVESVQGPVDIYEALLDSGELYRTIYINMYAKSTSETPPRGFVYKVDKGE